MIRVMHEMRMWVGVMTLGLLLGACGSDSTNTDGGQDGSLGSLDGGQDAGLDGGDFSADGGEDVDAGPPPPVVAPLCRALKLRPRAFQEGSGRFKVGDVAGDFEVNELDGGHYSMKAAFTGCESYVFIQDLSGLPGYTGSDLLSSTALDGVLQSPKNLQIFFLIADRSASARETKLKALKVRIEDAMSRFYMPSEKKAVRARIHYVTDLPEAISGSLGLMIKNDLRLQGDPNTVVTIPQGDETRSYGMPPLEIFGIDREQRWDKAGNIRSMRTREPDLRIVTQLAAFYHAKAALADRFASETAVVEHVLLEGKQTERVFTVKRTLSDVARFSRLEFDVQVICDAANPFACSEWDRLAQIELCESEACAKPLELVRWITPYWRQGERRWGMDASPLVPLLKEGDNWIRVVMGPTWERKTERRVRVAMRLRADPNTPRPLRVDPLPWKGGEWNASYAAAHGAIALKAPEGAKRADLFTLITGHGQEGSSNCAEWCDHRHVFRVNGGDPITRLSEQAIGTEQGCADRVADGVVPGQWGNWTPSRAYWCPGLPVAFQQTPLTGLRFDASGDELSYASHFGESGDPQNGQIALSAYVLWYGP